MIFESLARKHWARYLPEKTATLKKMGIFEEAIAEAAEAARTELAILVSQGAQMEAAKEIVLKEHILLPPE